MALTVLPVWKVFGAEGKPGYSESLPPAKKGVLFCLEDDLWKRLGPGARDTTSALANFIPEETVEMYRRAETGASGMFLTIRW